jgi:hypothetical protein
VQKSEAGTEGDRLIEVVPATFFYEDEPERPYRGITVLSRRDGLYRIVDHVLEDTEEDSGEVIFWTFDPSEVREKWEELIMPLSGEARAALLTDRFRNLGRKKN